MHLPSKLPRMGVHMPELPFIFHTIIAPYLGDSLIIAVACPRNYKIPATKKNHVTMYIQITFVIQETNDSQRLATTMVNRHTHTHNTLSQRSIMNY